MASKNRVLPRIVITPYSGDPELLEFFIEQITEKIKASNLSNEEALAFIKSKLIDRALKFYVSSYPCRRATEPERLFQVLRQHFGRESSGSIASQYKNITFTPNEDIRDFANRLELLTRKRFPDLPDSSIEQLLTAKLTEAIPASYEVHLLTTKPKGFYEMVNTLASLQEVLLSKNPSSESQSFASLQHFQAQVDPVANQTHTSSASVNNITTHSSDSTELVCQFCTKVGHSARQCESVNKVLSSANSHTTSSVPARKQCQYCSRFGHTADSCFLIPNNSRFKDRKIHRTNRTKFPGFPSWKRPTPASRHRPPFSSRQSRGGDSKRSKD